ncbi:MAG: IPT/TIG domain-containing protein, partial [Nocardioidaceae bacterium]
MNVTLRALFVLSLAALWMPLATRAAATAQFWQELGGSGSGDGLSDSVTGLAALGSPRNVAVGVGPDGRPVVAYIEFFGPRPGFSERNVIVRRWNGTIWQPLGGALNEGLSGVVEQPRITVNAAGEIFVAWRQGVNLDLEPPLFEIYLLKWDGTQWLELDGSASGGGVTQSPSPNLSPLSFSLTVGTDGHPVLAYDASSTTEFDPARSDSQVVFEQVYVRRWTGSAWQYLGSDLSGGGASNAPTFAFLVDRGGVLVTEHAFHNAVHPSVAVGPDNLPVVAFIYGSAFPTSDTPPAEYVNQNNDVYVVKWDGAAWTPMGPAVPTGDTAAGLGGAGGVSDNPGKSRPGNSAVAADADNSPSIAVGPDNRPVVAWGDDSPGGEPAGIAIFARKWNDATNAWGELAGSGTGIGISGAADFNAYATAAIGFGGQPIIAWNHDETPSGIPTVPSIRVKRFNGTAWVEMGLGSATGRGIGGANSLGFGPWMAVSSNGNPIVAWGEAGIPSIEQVFLRVFTPSAPPSAPTITSFSPLSGPVGTTVTVAGANLGSVTAMTFNGLSVAPTAVTPTSFKAVVPDGATTGRISATTPVGIAVSAANFKISPKVETFAPTSLLVGGLVTIQGSHLKLGSTPPTVTIGALTLTSAFIVSTSATSIQALVPPTAVSGKIGVTTADGTGLSATDLAVVRRPTITGYVPASGAVGTRVTVMGSNLAFATSVTFTAGITVSPTTPLQTSLKVVVPAGAVSGPLSVTNPAGSSITAPRFRVLPKINNFSPPSGLVGDTVTVNGTNLMVGSVTPIVRIGAFTLAPPFQSLSPTQIVFTIPSAAATGKISVVTSDGTAISAGNLIVIRQPTVSSFAPASGAVGALVTINGTHMSTVSSVDFASSVTATAAISVTPTAVLPTSVKAVVPFGAGSGRLRVTNPAGSALSAAAFKVLPRITLFSPGSASAGDSVTINGRNLVVGGVTPIVKIGNFAAEVTSATTVSVTATVPGPASTARISVVTADGTAVSDAALFVTTPPFADLVLTQVSAPLYAVRTKASAPRTMNVTTAVANRGPVTSGAFTIGIVAVPSGAAESDGVVVLGMRRVTSLAPGAISTATTAVPVSEELETGAYRIAAIANFGASVSELDDANNRLEAAELTTILQNISGPTPFRPARSMLSFGGCQALFGLRNFTGTLNLSQSLTGFTSDFTGTASLASTPASGTPGVSVTVASIQGTFDPDDGQLIFAPLAFTAGGVFGEINMTGFVEGDAIVLDVSGFAGNLPGCNFSGQLRAMLN